MFRRGRRNTQSTSDNSSNDIPDVPIRLGRLFTYLSPYIKRLMLAIIALTISALLSLVFPYVIRNVVDSVLVNSDEQLLNQITLLLIGVFLFRSITTFIQNYNLNYIGERIVVDIREQLYAHMQTLSLQFYADRRVGELISRLASDVTIMRTALTSNVNTLLQQSLIMVGSIVIMVVLNWRLSLFIIIMTPIIVGLGAIFGFYVRRFSTAVQDETAEATIVAEEVFQNIREVKSFRS